MKNKKMKYIKNRAVPFTELVGVPLFLGKAINRLIKNEKISDSLDNIIKTSKENVSSYNDISNIELMKFQTEYKKAENFFAKYFVKYEESPVEDRIEYCLEEYKTELNKINSASNSLVLEEDFLKGAERTLMLYYILKERNLIERNRLKQQELSKQEIDQYERQKQGNEEKKSEKEKLELLKIEEEGKRIRKFKKENSLELLFEKPEEYLVFQKLLEDYYKENKLDIGTTLIAGVLIELKDKRVIKSRYKSKKVTDKQLIDGMKATFDFTIPKSTFSNARANLKINKEFIDEVLSFIEPFL